MAKSGEELTKLKNENKSLKQKVAEKNLEHGDNLEDDKQNSEVTDLKEQFKNLESCIQSVKKRNYEQVAEIKKVAIVIKRELGDNVDSNAVYSVMIIAA